MIWKFDPTTATNKAGHLYVAYADTGTNSGDKADIFLLASTDGGVTWTNLVRVNTVWTNDQWMPVMCVNSNGTQLFIGWYDRRNDTNNSLIDVYGRWGYIATNGSVSFSNEFRITTTNFPPAFAGTNATIGHYDPVYPASGVDLNWWYPEWPADEGAPSPYAGHVGEYNGVWAEGPYVYIVWSDSRLRSAGTVFPRNQSDVRMVRLSWP